MQSFKDAKKVTSINIISNSSKSDKALKKRFGLVDLESKEKLLDDDIEMVLIGLNKLKEKEYSDSDKTSERRRDIYVCKRNS